MAEATRLRDERAAQQPQYEWIVQPRTAGDWAVVRLPRMPRIDSGSIVADTGTPIEAKDDPRPALIRNVPPYGPG